MDTLILHQQCPPFNIYSSLISCGTHVSAWHMYLTGWGLILFLLSYFLLEIVPVMNDLHCHQKVVTYLTKILKWLWYDTITKSPITNNTLHERKCSTELLVFSKGVLKNFANFTGKHPCRVKCEPKSLTFPCSLHLIIKRLLHTVAFQWVLQKCFWLYIRHI